MLGIFDRMRYTWGLMGASWEVLKKDRKLLIFPLLSGLACLVVILSFGVPLMATGSWDLPAEDAAVGRQVAYYAVLFAFYVCNYFVIIFFNSAVMACALIRMQGGDPTVGDGLREAGSRAGLIFGWAMVSATVGLLLRIIERRSNTVARIVASIVGMAWSVVTFLAVPVMVVERKGPLEALRRSASLLKQTWGEQLIGNFSFGIIFMLLYIPGVVVLVLGAMAGSQVLLLLCIGAAVLYFVLLALVQSVLHSIFRAALYLYALNGEAPPGYERGDLLRGAMGAR